MDTQKLKEIISKKYQLECEKESQPPNKSLLKYFNLPMSSKSQYIDIIFRGNDKYNFTSRMSNKDLIYLCTAFDESASVIRHIDLSYNLISDESAKILAKFLSKCSDLESLNLQGNDIENPGAQVISESLQENQNIQYLNLSFNRIKTDGTMSVVEFLFTNKSLKELNLGNIYKN